MIQAKAKERQKQATGGDRKSENFKNQGVQKSAPVENRSKARDELAKIAGVSHDTIEKGEIR